MKTINVLTMDLFFALLSSGQIVFFVRNRSHRCIDLPEVIGVVAFQIDSKQGDCRTRGRVSGV